MTRNYTSRDTCRSCGSCDLLSLYTLDQVVSDFVDKNEIKNGNRVPIDIVLCRKCTLVQNIHTAPSDLLYKKTYWYKSGITRTMKDALRDIVVSAMERVNLSNTDVVLDIGANDGTLLSYYPVRDDGVLRIGCEPAENLQKACEDNCDVLIKDFWSYEAYKKTMDELDLEVVNEGNPPRAKIITAIGMFYDLEDPNQFIGDIAKALHKDGLFIAQLMCLKQTVQKKDIGNFAHEHLEFYSLKSLEQLLAYHNLEIRDIEENSVNGGSYRLYIKHRRELIPTVVTPEYRRVTTAMNSERYPALDSPLTYSLFFQEMERERNRLKDFVTLAKTMGKKVWVYGASTKGNVILQYAGLDHTMIDAAADRDPAKWDKYTVETGIPITSEEQFRAAQPDYAIMLPYAFKNEMLEREKEWRSRGGKFIIPIPTFEVI